MSGWQKPWIGFPWFSQDAIQRCDTAFEEDFLARGGEKC